MTVKPGVERHVKDCSVIDDETARSPLEPEALSGLLQCFTDGGTKQAVKIEVGESRTRFASISSESPNHPAGSAETEGRATLCVKPGGADRAPVRAEERYLLPAELGCGSGMTCAH